MKDRAGVLLLAALAPAAMLAFDPGGLYPFGPAKWLAVSTLVPAGAAALWCRRPLRCAPGPTLAMAALVAAMVLAAAAGEDGVYAWLGTPERHLGVLAWALVAVAFLAGQSLGGAQAQTAVGRGIVVAGLGLGLAAATEAVGIGPHTLDAGSRLGATFGSPAYLGAACCLLLPIVLAMVLDRQQPRPWRIAAAVATATTAIATIGSGARAGWVGLATALAITALVNRRRLPRIGPLPLLGTAAALAAVVLLTPVGGRITATFDADAPGGSGRLDEWRVATRVLADHPLTGVGPEGYRIAFADGVDASYEAEHGRDPLPDRAHSAPLDIALAGGPLGLLAWVAVLVTTAPFVRRGLRSADPLLVGIAAAVVAYVAGELLLFPLAELEPVAALLGGLLIGATATRARTAVLPRATPVLLAAVTVVALTAGSLDVAADRSAHAAIDSLTEDPDHAVDAARRAVDLRPDVLRNHLLLAVALEADDQGIVTALAAVDDALDLSPGDPIAQRRKAGLLVRRAQATLVPDHIAAARAYVDDLLHDDPLNTELRRLAAQLGDRRDGTG